MVRILLLCLLSIAFSNQSVNEQFLLHCLIGSVEDMESDLKNGADVNALNNSGYGCAHNIAILGSLSKLQFLAKYDANLEIQTPSGYTPLWLAAQEGHGQIVGFLLSQNVDIDRKDFAFKKTPLLRTLQFSRLKTAEILLKNGADPSKEDGSGYDSIRTVILGVQGWGKNLNTILDLLIRFGADSKARRYVRYSCESYWEAESLVRYFIKHTDDVNYQNKDGVTDLMVCTRLGSVQAVDFLLRNGANAKLRDNKNRNAIHYIHPDAFPSVKAQITELLKKYGADE